VTRKPTAPPLSEAPPDLFTPSPEADRVPSQRVRWPSTFRLVPSRYPPIPLFERVAPAGDWEALMKLESLTNPRLRDEVGNIQLVPPEKRVNGPGASIVMAPFTHCSPLRQTRFSDGTFGVYYAGHKFETALLEVSFHMTRFHAASNDPPLREQYRAYKGSINKVMHDVRGPGFEHLLDPATTYDAPQAFAAMLRRAGSNGIVYPSVRHAKGDCIAAFWPNVVSIPVQERHIELKWDGASISEWFDGAAGTWQPMPR
jgi:RES domain